MVIFQCSPGLVPSRQMLSVCATNGNWTPDPAELVCREPGSYNNDNQILCNTTIVTQYNNINVDYLLILNTQGTSNYRLISTRAS